MSWYCNYYSLIVSILSGKESEHFHVSLHEGILDILKNNSSNFGCDCTESVNQFGQNFIFMILYFATHNQVVFVYLTRLFLTFSQ